MSFYELLDKAIELLERRRRISYRGLKLELGVDDEQLEALKEEIIDARQLATDEDGRLLVYSGDQPPVPRETTVPQSGSSLIRTPSDLVDKIIRSRAALEGERKHVTVLFADIKGSTELIQSLDPEDARRILDPALELMMDAVHQFEGTVNQVLGDGIMALFGAPLAHEDHALRACYAALQMQASMFSYADRLHDTHGVSLEIRVGLNSGQVVVRTINNDLHMEYSAVGHTTHLAARMEQAAEAGSIVLTPETLRLVEGLVEVESRGKIRIKGLVDDLEIFELRDAKPVRKLRASAHSGLSRFVGREPEAATFRAVMDRALHGHGQVVAMVGEAGLGKSRLVYELTQPSFANGWKVVESSSVSYGKVKAYFPVVDLLRNYFGIDEDAAPDDVRSQVLGGHLSLLDTSLQENAAPLLSLLEALPQDSPFLALERHERHQATMEALKQLFFSESQRQPLLMVFEDLHCIDNGTQAFLDTFVETLPTARLLLLVNYRPEYRHNWGHKTYYTQIRLNQLTSEGAQALLDDLLGNAKGLTELRRMLLERTEGNPFFLEESVRHLAANGILAGQKGAYHLTDTAIRTELPSNVQTVLAARIDRLPPEEKELLQTAAVIGTDVPLPLLKAVSQLQDPDLHGHLRNLLAGEFLYESRLYPERQVTFRHGLTNEVAYESLLQDRRRALHANIVAALEELAGDRLEEQVERLAPHALRGHLWEKSVKYFWQAGKKAMSRSGFHEARLCFEQALQALEHFPDSKEKLQKGIDLRVELRHGLFMLGDILGIAEHLSQAEKMAETLQDRHRRSIVLNFMTANCNLSGNPEQALVFGRRALALTQPAEHLAPHIIANYYLGVAHHNLGDYQEGVSVLQRTLDLLKEKNLEHERFGTAALISVVSRTWLVRCLGETGRFDEAQTYGEEGVRTAEAVNHPYSLTYAYFSLGLFNILKGDFENAGTILERGLALTEKANIPVQTPLLASTLGVAYSLGGRTNEGIALLEDAVKHTRAMGRMSGQSMRMTWLAGAYLSAGRLEYARATADEALELALKNNERGHEAWVRHLQGEIASVSKPYAFETVQFHYSQALTMAREREMKPLIAHCQLGLGRSQLIHGDLEHGRNNISDASDLYQAMDMSFWLQRAKKTMDEAEQRRNALPR